LAVLGTVACASLIGIVSLASPAHADPVDVGLGTVGSYSVLGAETVTNTGPSTISSDLGVSPGTAITGFPPGVVGGNTHATDAAAAQAQSDLGIAYDNAAGQATTASVSGDLVGQTLIAGVYTSSGPLGLSGTVTLDGANNPDSVFIFQVASTLITATSSRVATIRGAQACHIFWQVGSSATLGTASTFQGTVMALASVTVTTSVHVKGRALAQTGAVTLDNDVFIDPSCNNDTDITPPTASTTTLTSTTATTPTGTDVTLTATPSSTGGSPTGTVTFSENGVTMGTADVVAGAASLTIPAGPTATTRTFQARYNGSPDIAPSDSTNFDLVVTTVAAPPTTVAPSAPVTIASTTPVPTITNDTVLAQTGPSHETGTWTTAGILLLAGAVLMWIGRRRYDRQH
jgi:LPXTG-motif cell wall-anchored protein